MKSTQLVLGSVLIGMSASAASQSCEDRAAGTLSVDAPQYTIVFRSEPAKIEVGRHFALELVICPKGGAPITPEVVRVDGFMPDHGHGMNYRATLESLGASRYRAQGLMFHMPGRWDFVIDVRTGGKNERLRRSFALE